MKYCIVILTLFLFSGGLEGQSFLKTEGKKIVNEQGENFIFRGMGLGGWMLQEGYMLKTASFANAQHKIREKIVELVGVSGADQFYEEWLANHVRKADIEALAEWGFNSVRLPMHYNLYTLPIEDDPVEGEDTWLELGFAMTDSLIEWCRASGIYVILDLHAAPGGQGKDEGISDYNPDKPSLWESPENRRKTVALWKRIAERYADEPVGGAYDLINETNWPMDGNGPLRDLYFQLTDSIRAVDQKHIIFIEGNWFANDFTNLTPPWTDNLVYSPHKYWSLNDEASIQWALDIREQHNVPIMFGECGENSNVWFRDAIALFEERNIGWAWWPMKKVDDIAGPLSIRRSDEYDLLLNYWENGGNVPDSTLALNTLMQLTEDIKIENCTYQRDVVDAMFRQVSENGSKAFFQHTVPGMIYSVDYDMGTVGAAYFDTQVANYQVSTGNFTTWNNGWSYRNDGVDIEQSSDEMGNGFNVGWMNKDEWLQYEVEAEAGVYEAKVRVATESGDGKFHLSSGTAAITDVQSVPNTSGWQNWETISVPGIILSANDKYLRFYVDEATFNFSSMEFVKTGESVDLATEFLSAETIDETAFQLNINKALDVSTVSDLSGFSLQVDGFERSIESVTVDENNSRIMYFTVDEKFRSLQDIRVSYNGDVIKAVDGTPLSAFSMERVENKVAIIHQLPTRIEMEDFFFQSGMELESTSDEGGGENIGFLDAGDYADYMVDAAEAGSYSVDFRTAALSEVGGIELQVLTEDGGAEIIGEQDFPSTGGWQSWATTEGASVVLPAGELTLRVRITKPLFNMNWMEFSFLSDLEEEMSGSAFSVFPSPTQDHIYFSDIGDATGWVSIYNAVGAHVHSGLIEEGESLDVSNFPAGQYFVLLRIDSGDLNRDRFIKQ